MRQIAEALGDDPANAIRAAGQLVSSSLPTDADDEVVQHILGLDVDDEMKQMMLNRHRDNAERDRQRYIEQVQRDVEFWQQRRQQGAA